MKRLSILKPGVGYSFVVGHDLKLRDGWYRNVRPHNILTFVAASLVPEARAIAMLETCAAIEVKLAGVELNRRAHVSAFVAGRRTDHNLFVQDYADAIAVTATLEAYLNSLYTTCELVAKANQLLHPNLPRSFRDQAAKDDLFAFREWPWLQVMYDARSHFTHYAIAIPNIEDGTVFIDFSFAPRQQEMSERAKWLFPSYVFWNMADDLHGMLDLWANRELEALSPDLEYEILHQVDPRTRPIVERVKSAELIDLWKSVSRSVSKVIEDNPS